MTRLCAGDGVQLDARRKLLQLPEFVQWQSLREQQQSVRKQPRAVLSSQPRLGVAVAASQGLAWQKKKRKITGSGTYHLSLIGSFSRSLKAKVPEACQRGSYRRRPGLGIGGSGPLRCVTCSRGHAGPPPAPAPSQRLPRCPGAGRGLEDDRVSKGGKSQNRSSRQDESNRGPSRA